MRGIRLQAWLVIVPVSAQARDIPLKLGGFCDTTREFIRMIAPMLWIVRRPSVRPW